MEEWRSSSGKKNIWDLAAEEPFTAVMKPFTAPYIALMTKEQHQPHVTLHFALTVERTRGPG